MVLTFGGLVVSKDKTAIVLPRNVKKYIDESESCHFDAAYKKLKNIAIQAAVDESIERIIKGKAVKVKKYKKIGAVVLRYPRKIRIYYGVHEDSTILLLVGTQTQQSVDISRAQDDWNNFTADPEIALRYWNDYLSANRK